MPHVPQLAGSLWVLVQRALVPVPHGSGDTVGQVHALPEHDCPAGQTMPHTPQLLASVAVLVQTAVVPVPHGSGDAAGQLHVLAEHNCWLGHTMPHAPQLLESCVVLAQYELEVPALHSVGVPDGQVDMQL
jgi:hypothetical protein